MPATVAGRHRGAPAQTTPSGLVAQVQRGRGDPAVGAVLRLAERMPGPFTRHPQAHVGVEQPRAGPNHLGAADVVLGPPEPSLAP